MIYETLRAFVSSRMAELAPERAAIAAALGDIRVEAWTFETDAGARPETVRQTFLDEIERADLYIGVFWRGYGEYTIEEYEHARKLELDCLLYEKRADIEEQRDPELQEFLDRVGRVEDGLTVQWFDTVDELREMVKRDLDGWRNRIVKRARREAVRAPARPANTPDRRGLELLLGRVRSFWIEGVLERSLHGAGLAQVGAERRPDAIDHPWEAVLELPYEDARVVPPGQDVVDVFDDVQSSLLVLGAPGSGKSTTLLELARALVRRAEHDPSAPVPVVLLLSTWGERCEPLIDWIDGELSAKYQVPARVGRKWLEENRLLLLLDGLDEVALEHREACVTAIHEFTRTVGVPGIAITSRLEEYTALPSKLRTNGAICLQPLVPEQIDAYVAEGGERLRGLHVALQADPNLRDLARSPLMLSIMSLAYEGASAEALSRDGGGTAAARRTHLFHTYVDRMFRRGRDDDAFSREETSAWLAWLARGLRDRNRSLFLIEELQADWLASRWQRRLFRVLVSLAFGALCGVIGASTWKTWSYVSPDSQSFLAMHGYPTWMAACAAWMLLVGAGEALCSGHAPRPVPANRAAVGRRFLTNLGIAASAWALVWTAVVVAAGPEKATWQVWEWVYPTMSGMVGASVVAAWGSRRDVTRDVRTVEALGPSARELLLGAAMGAACAVVLSIGVLPLKLEQVRFGRAGLAIVMFVLATEIGALLRGFPSRLVERRTRPNQGIRLSLRNALVVGLLPAPIFALTAGLLIWFLDPVNRSVALPAALTAGLTLALSSALWFGGLDALKHYLLRALLLVRRQAPRDLAGFLDHAARLNFVRRAGGGWLFVHRLLLEHFAGGESLSPDRDVAPK